MIFLLIDPIKAPVLVTHHFIIQVSVEEGHTGAAHSLDKNLDFLSVAVVAEDCDEAAHRGQLAVTFPE